MELLLLYLSLALAFFKIGLFGFGGGYAMLSLIQHEIVVTHQWISVEDFTNIVAISQTTPGPIAFNSATYIGYSAVTDSGFSHLAGIIGSAICTLSVSVPSLILMTIVFLFFKKLSKSQMLQAVLQFLRPAVIGLIAAAALMLVTPDNFVDVKSGAIFGIVAIASLKKADPILLIALSGVAGFFLY